MMDRLYRRVQMLVGIGKTSAPAVDSGNVQTQQVKLRPDGAVRDDSVVLSFFGFSSHAPVGSDVVVLFVGGDRSKGVVVGTANQVSRFRNLGAGESVVHNAHAMSILLAAEGITVDAGNMPVTIKNAPKVRADTPRFECTGEVVAMCDGNSVALSTHRNTNVQTGGGTSGPPLPHS